MQTSGPPVTVNSPPRQGLPRRRLTGVFPPAARAIGAELAGVDGRELAGRASSFPKGSRTLQLQAGVPCPTEHGTRSAVPAVQLPAELEAGRPTPARGLPSAAPCPSAAGGGKYMAGVPAEGGPAMPGRRLLWERV